MDRTPILSDWLSDWPQRIADKGAHALRPHLLAEAPPAPVHPTRSDYDLNPEHRPAAPRKLRPAAVLMPIIQRAEPTMLFTRRTPHLARHAGQVSFPGGRVDKADTNLAETALRETEEETGITSDFVALAGFLDPYETGTGFAIVPVVGVLQEGFHLIPDPGEVAEVFEVPLSFLLDPANRELKSAEWKGQRREFHAYNYGRHYIWGATAAILVQFMERLNR
jgi:8-oxo-dGTP pyrophosphatase MutT (NUDIX family)